MFLLNRTFSLITINVLFIIILISVDASAFLNKINIYGLMFGLAANMIILGAMTSLMISGGIDLTVGSIIGFSALIFALLLKSGIPIPIAIIGALIGGVFIGSINGYIIAYLGISPFITTLSGWFILRAVILLISGASSMAGFPKNLNLISNYKVLKVVPTFIIFAFICVIVFEVLMKKNKFFRQNFLIGGNEPAAKLLGIKVKKVKLINYMVTGLMAAIAGVFLTARYMAFMPEVGSGSTFGIITAIIIGGTSLTGGEGSVLRSFLGLFFVNLIYDSIALLGINIQWNDAFIGAVLLIMAILNTNNQRMIQNLNKWELKSQKKQKIRVG